MLDPRDEYHELLFAKFRRERLGQTPTEERPSSQVAQPTALPAGIVTPAKFPTAADREFESVRMIALARIAAEDKARAEAAAARAAKRREEDAAVSAILGAMGINRAGAQSTDTL